MRLFLLFICVKVEIGLYCRKSDVKHMDKTVKVTEEAHKKAKIEATKEGKSILQWLSELIMKAPISK